MKCSICNEKIGREYLIPSPALAEIYNHKSKKSIIVYILKLFKGSEVWHTECYQKMKKK